MLLLLLARPALASPWCATLDHLALHPPRAERPARASGPVGPPPPGAVTTCVDPQQLADDESFDGTYDQTRTTTHFLIAWDAANASVVDGTIDAYADALETSWETEIDGLGWPAPDQTDTCLITVLVAQFPSSWGDTGGYTNTSDTGTVPYMVLNTDWLQYGGQWTETLVAHEFNHASQFSYDVFWDPSDWWYWESTAEWMPDNVFDDGDTYVWSLWSYLYAPQLGLESQDEYVDYGHFAFNTVLAEQLDVDAVRRVWAAAGPDDGVAEAVDAGLEPDGVTFEDAVLSYTSHVAAMDVDEQDVWLEALGYFEVDPWRAHVDSYPAGESYDGDDTPEAMGQNFLHFTGAPGGTLTLDFAGDPEAGGAPSDWALTLAAVSSSGEVTHTVTHADAGGLASIPVEGLGDTVSDVYLGVIPMGAIGTKNAGWTWSAALAEGDTGGADTGEGEDPKACGCQSAAGDGPMGLLAVGFGLVAARRRPR